MTNTIHRGVMDQILNQNLERWSRLDAFMEECIGRVVNNTDFKAAVAAFVTQRAPNAI